MQATTRAVTADDFAVWRELWRTYLVFYDTAVDDEIYTTTFARLLNNEPYDPNGLLAMVDDEVVGLTHYMQHRHCWRLENVTYLQDLFTTEAARGCGVATALIEAVYRIADVADCPRVYWLTHELNHTARHLYDKIATKTEFVKYQR